MGVAPMERSYFVYIMSNVSKMLYVGVTNGLQKRVFQHKTKLVPGFTEKYNLYKLVYFEILPIFEPLSPARRKLKAGCAQRK